MTSLSELRYRQITDFIFNGKDFTKEQKIFTDMKIFHRALLSLCSERCTSSVSSHHITPSCSLSGKLLLTLQEQLNPKQDKRRASLVLNPVQGEETVAPVSLKEFALENFR